MSVNYSHTIINIMGYLGLDPVTVHQAIEFWVFWNFDWLSAFLVPKLWQNLGKKSFGVIFIQI